jgi:hypothetical protein
MPSTRGTCRRSRQHRIAMVKPHARRGQRAVPVAAADPPEVDPHVARRRGPSGVRRLAEACGGLGCEHL